MVEYGYIRLHRSIQTHWIWPKYVVLWEKLLFLAMYRDGWVTFDGAKVWLRRGELLTTDRILARVCGMKKSSVHRGLVKFREDGMIEDVVVRVSGTRHGTTIGTRIRIVNYDNYQALPREHPSGWDTVRDAERDLKEVSNKNEAAAADVLSELTCPTPSRRSSDSDQCPPELRGVIGAIRSITGEDVDWPAEELGELVDLSADVPWPTIRARVTDLTLREKRKGKRIRSLRYYIRAIREDCPSTSGTFSDRPVSRPHVEAAGTPIRPTPPRPSEPDWNLAKTTIQTIMEKLRQKPDEA